VRTILALEALSCPVSHFEAGQKFFCRKRNTALPGATDRNLEAAFFVYLRRGRITPGGRWHPRRGPFASQQRVFYIVKGTTLRTNGL